jgi:uncharacterized membrane protein YedE/YeeE
LLQAVEPLSQFWRTLMGTNLAAWKLLGLIGVALALAVPASASDSAWTFRSPTGNITCEVSAGGTSGTWVFCQSFQRPQSVRLSREGDVAVCQGRHCLRPRPLNSMRLKYGSSVRIGPFRCSSRRYAISCWVGSFPIGIGMALASICTARFTSSDAYAAASCYAPDRPASPDPPRR